MDHWASDGGTVKGQWKVKWPNMCLLHVAFLKINVMFCMEGLKFWTKTIVQIVVNIVEIIRYVLHTAIEQFSRQNEGSLTDFFERKIWSWSCHDRKPTFGQPSPADFMLTMTCHCLLLTCLQCSISLEAFLFIFIEKYRFIYTRTIDLKGPKWRSTILSPLCWWL